MINFSFEIVATENKARTGVISTPHGMIKTPAFSPVGTRAAVRGLDPQDLVDAKSQVVLANTYHLYLSPGDKVIEEFGGLGSFMNWKGPTITDSGGYQVSFLWSKNKKMVKVNSDEAIFRSHIDGSVHKISPEKSMQIQSSLGADIIMAFDNPIPLGVSSKKVKEFFVRSKDWEKRSLAEWQKIQKKRENFQALFGVVQGENSKERIEFLEFINDLGFPGIAMGGEVIGADIQKTKKALSEIPISLINNKPVHALGLGGGIEGILEAIGEGVDTFDNTSVTRLAREGYLYIYPKDGGRKQNKWRKSIISRSEISNKNPISKSCNCFTCNNFSTGYIRHLLLNKEALGVRLTTIHNIHFVNSLMDNIRHSIEKGQFNQLKNGWLEAD